RELLAYIASKGGSEGVCMVIAGQRGTAGWMGGADVRANISVVCVGKVSRAGEIMHAAGDMGLLLPNMATYGEGHKGVWAIAELGEDPQVGRTFLLKEPADLRKIATARRVPAMAGATGSGEPPPAGDVPAGNLPPPRAPGEPGSTWLEHADGELGD